jgi:predicted nucleic acid-binding protein
VILVDSSVWVDHLRKGDEVLRRLLDEGQVLAHPWVVGELALGHLRQREEILGLLHALPQAVTATPEETLELVQAHRPHGLGIGYVDAQLLAATRLTPEATLWTRDKRLDASARQLACAADLR